MKLETRPIREKVFRVTALLVALPIILSAISLLTLQNMTFDKRAVSELTALSELISVGIGPAVLFNDKVEVRRILEKLIKTSDIHGTWVFSPTREDLFLSVPFSPPPERLVKENGFYKLVDGFVYVSDLKDDSGNVFGLLVLNSSLKKLKEEQKRILFLWILITLITSCAAYWLVRYLNKALTRPIMFLSDIVADITKKGNYTLRASISSGDEIGILAQNFNKMLEVISERENELRESESRYRLIVENHSDLVIKMDIQGKILYASPSFCQFFNKTQEAILGKSCLSIMNENEKETSSSTSGIEKLFTPPYLSYIEQHILIGGKWHWVSWRAKNILAEDKQPEAIVAVGREITERKQAEEQKMELEHRLAHSQKMESVGRLAGGIAHDFNNLLTPILGYSELLRMDLKENSEQISKIDEIIKAGMTAKDVARQLLAFARKQPLDIKIINLNEVILKFQKILTRTLPENIRVEMRLKANPSIIKGDASQIEQVLLNLAINAKDAMPSGGLLMIETDNKNITREDLELRPDVHPGEYVSMCVSDTGIGMTPEIIKKAFEPFFTTKGEHSGTGLGLSIVDGIVKQHGGFIAVYSEPGKGTTFRISLPAEYASEELRDVENLEKEHLGRGELVLLVEDQKQVRILTEKVLAQYGYKIIVAANGNEAENQMKALGVKIDLLLTDVILPDTNGKNLYEKLSPQNNSLRVLYMSGYTSSIIDHHIGEGAMKHFIAKPFVIKDLLLKIREVLDNKAL